MQGQQVKMEADLSVFVRVATEIRVETGCASPALLPLLSPSPPVRCWVPWASWAWCCVAAGAASQLHSMGPALRVRGPSWDGVLR